MTAKEPNISEESQAAESPFTTRADTELSFIDMLSRQLDAYIYAPLKIIASDWRGLVGGSIMIFYILMGTVGLSLYPEPVTFDGEAWIRPFQYLEFPLGTDNLGRGILGQVIYATPTMLEMMFAGGLFACSIGTMVGTFAGFKGGNIDRILMTIADIGMTIPGLPLIIIIMAIFEPTQPALVGIILTINGWAGLSRAIRSQVLSTRQNSYVEASRALGLSSSSIVLKDILSNIMPYVLIAFVQTSRGVIFSAVGLYFIGLLPFAGHNWGIMMNTAYYSHGMLYNPEARAYFYGPMLAIALLATGLILLSQSLDRVFNPRVRARASKFTRED